MKIRNISDKYLRTAARKVDAKNQRDGVLDCSEQAKLRDVVKQERGKDYLEKLLFTNKNIKIVKNLEVMPTAARLRFMKEDPSFITSMEDPSLCLTQKALKDSRQLITQVDGISSRVEKMLGIGNRSYKYEMFPSKETERHNSLVTQHKKLEIMAKESREYYFNILENIFDSNKYSKDEKITIFKTNNIIQSKFLVQHPEIITLIDKPTKKEMLNTLYAVANFIDENKSGDEEKTKWHATNAVKHVLKHCDKYPEVQVALIELDDRHGLYIKTKYLKKLFKSKNKEVQIALVKKYHSYLEDIKKPCEEAKLIAVSKSGYLMRSINNPSKDLQLAAVGQDRTAIRYIKRPIEEVQLMAVEEDGTLLEHIKYSTEKVKLAAVKQFGGVIKIIKNPSKQVQLAAVKSRFWAIDHIKNPSREVISAAKKAENIAISKLSKESLAAIAPDPMLVSKLLFNTGGIALPMFRQSELKEQLRIIANYGSNIRNIVMVQDVAENIERFKYLPNPSEDMQLSVVSDKGLQLKYIKNPSLKVITAAVRDNGGALKYVKNPSEKIKMIALSSNGWVIKLIKNPSYKHKLAAVNANGYVIRAIENPSKRVIYAALAEEGRAIRYVKKPTKRMIKTAFDSMVKSYLSDDISLDEAKRDANEYIIKHVYKR